MADFRKLPTEEQEQIWLFEWAQLQAGKYPALSMMYHVPNGGKRTAVEAARFRAAGVKAGVPDIFLPCAKASPCPFSPAHEPRLYHGLYIELKRTRGGCVSDAQKVWVRDLRLEGYAVEVCTGWRAAADVILAYLEGRYTPLYQL